MFRKHLLLKLIIVALVVAIGAYVVAYAASGDASDPLISLSYIENVLKPELMTKVDSLVGDAKDELTDSIDSTLDQFKSSIDVSSVGNALDSLGDNGYETTALTDGQSVTMEAGCEFLFVDGEGLCVGSVNDTTSGEAVSDGRMEVNHLYICPGEASIVADGEAQVLVKGQYSVN